jgi:Zn-finger nucleic acid-binding protein
METVSSGDSTFNECRHCYGTWLSGKSLNAILTHYDSDSSIEEIFDEIMELEFRDSERHCPACKNMPLMEVDIDDVELDYCTACKGLFFDRGELEAVFPAARGAAPGAGRHQSGKIRNFIGSILSWLKVDD